MGCRVAPAHASTGIQNLVSQVIFIGIDIGLGGVFVRPSARPTLVMRQT